ncbi:hypothetical protein [Gleimia hominis]|uniref:hypothetical protein n=1 Tax=Gleimia hominis TaxID=595468 RepID=UPI0011AF077F|nr:hypothetical protein [Gleimia hominis]WIK64138.1 hypothetical protein CJ187_007485 [Gleimia hominis]
MTYSTALVEARRDITVASIATLMPLLFTLLLVASSAITIGGILVSSPVLTIVGGLMTAAIAIGFSINLIAEVK